jgi:hypothetical protein
VFNLHLLWHCFCRVYNEMYRIWHGRLLYHTNTKLHVRVGFRRVRIDIWHLFAISFGCKELPDDYLCHSSSSNPSYFRLSGFFLSRGKSSQSSSVVCFCIFKSDHLPSQPRNLPLVSFESTLTYVSNLQSLCSNRLQRP